MEDGFGLCKGTANYLSNQQSAGRRLNEIIQKDGSKYVFFMAQSKTNGSPYKVFFRNIKRNIKIKKIEKDVFVVVGSLGTLSNATSKEYKSRKLALESIKSCN